MEYIVEPSKTIFGDKSYTVLNKSLQSLEDWIYEAYLLKIEINEDGDIVTPFISFLEDKFPSAQFEREALLDSKRSSFTGMSVLKIKFLIEEEAKEYASILNEITKEKGER